MITTAAGHWWWPNRTGRAAWGALPGLLLVAALGLAPAAALGGSFSLGGGVSAFNVSSDHVPGGSGSTYELTWAYRSSLFSRLSMELLVTGSSRDFETQPVPSSGYPADAASFSLLAMGFRLDLLDPARSRWSPWLGAGMGLASLDWQSYAYSEGTVSPLLSLGVDVELLSGLLLRLRGSTLHGGSPGNLSCKSASIGLVWEFLRPPHHQRPQHWTSPAPPSPPTGTEPDSAPAPTLGPPGG